MEMEIYKIISERVKKLREQFGYSQAKVAEGAKICLASVMKSETGRPIGIESIKALANFYGVTIDYICGVTDEIDMTYRARIIKGYSYEKYLVKCNRDDDIKKPVLGTYRPVWPYNLLDELLINDTWSKPLSDDQIDGLKYAIESLSDREKYCVKAYFLEEKSMKDIAYDCDVTKERIRQVIHRALRKLKSPSRFKYIRYGFEGYQIVDQTRKEELRRKHLQVLIHQNDLMEKELAKRNNDEEIEKHLSTSLLNLELSVRSYNALCRWKYAGGPEINTLYDLTRVTLQDLMSCRHLGVKSIREIEAKLAEYGLKFKEEGIA